MGPAWTHAELPNGLHVVIEVRPEAPDITLALWMAGGNAAETDATNDAAISTVTTQRDVMREVFVGLDAVVDAGAAPDGVWIRVTATRDDAMDALALWPEPEAPSMDAVQATQATVLARQRLTRRSGKGRARLAADSALYPSALAYPSNADQRDTGAIGDASEWRRYIASSGPSPGDVLIVSGAVRPERVLRLSARSLGQWPTRAETTRRPEPRSDAAFEVLPCPSCDAPGAAISWWSRPEGDPARGRAACWAVASVLVEREGPMGTWFGDRGFVHQFSCAVDDAGGRVTMALQATPGAEREAVDALRTAREHFGSASTWTPLLSLVRDEAALAAHADTRKAFRPVVSFLQLTAFGGTPPAELAAELAGLRRRIATLRPEELAAVFAERSAAEALVVATLPGTSAPDASQLRMWWSAADAEGPTSAGAPDP